MLAGDLADDESVLRSIVGLRAELDELARHLDEAEKVAESIPHRRRHLKLVHSLGRKLLAVHEEWVDEVERELGQGR